MYRPRPTPSLWVEREESALWNRSKMWVSCSGGMVSPWLPMAM